MRWPTTPPSIFNSLSFTVVEMLNFFKNVFHSNHTIPFISSSFPAKGMNYTEWRRFKHEFETRATWMYAHNSACWYSLNGDDILKMELDYYSKKIVMLRNIFTLWNSVECVEKSCPIHSRTSNVPSVVVVQKIWIYGSACLSNTPKNWRKESGHRSKCTK